MGKAEVSAAIVAGAIAEATGAAGYTGATGAGRSHRGGCCGRYPMWSPDGATGAANTAEAGGDIVEQEIVEELLGACEPVCPETCVFPLSITDESCGECMKCHGMVFAGDGKGSWSVRDDCKEPCKGGNTETDACARCNGFEKAITKPCEDNDSITFNRDGRIGPVSGSKGALPG